VWPLVALPRVLLVRGIPLSHHHRKRPAPLPQRQPRRSEVNQDRAPLFGQVDIAGLDVTVEIVLGVDLPQPVQDPEHDLRGVFRVHSALGLLGEVLLEGFPLVVVHRQVAGPVGLKKVPDAHDVGVVESGEGAGLAQKPIEPVLKRLLLVPRVKHHRFSIGIPGGHVSGHVLFHRHPLLKPLVEGQVGDSKSPRFSQYLSDAVPPIEHRVEGQGHGAPLLPAHVTALRAGLALRRPFSGKTAWTGIVKVCVGHGFS